MTIINECLLEIWLFWSRRFFQCRWKRDSDFVHGCNYVLACRFRDCCICLDQNWCASRIWRHNISRQKGLPWKCHTDWSLRPIRYKFQHSIWSTTDATSTFHWWFYWLSRFLSVAFKRWRIWFVQTAGNSPVQLKWSESFLRASCWWRIRCAWTRVFPHVLPGWA